MQLIQHAKYKMNSRMLYFLSIDAIQFDHLIQANSTVRFNLIRNAFVALAARCAPRCARSQLGAADLKRRIEVKRCI